MMLHFNLSQLLLGVEQYPSLYVGYNTKYHRETSRQILLLNT